MHRRWLQTSWKLVSKCLHLRDINGNVYECCCPGVSASLTSSFSAGRVEPHLFPSHGGDVKLNEIGHVRCLPLIIRTYTACVVLTLSWWWSWWWSRQTGRQAGRQQMDRWQNASWSCYQVLWSPVCLQRAGVGSHCRVAQRAGCTSKGRL